MVDKKALIILAIIAIIVIVVIAMMSNSAEKKKREAELKEVSNALKVSEADLETNTEGNGNVKAIVLVPEATPQQVSAVDAAILLTNDAVLMLNGLLMELRALAMNVEEVIASIQDPSEDLKDYIDLLYAEIAAVESAVLDAEIAALSNDEIQVDSGMDGTGLPSAVEAMTDNDVAQVKNDVVLAVATEIDAEESKSDYAGAEQSKRVAGLKKSVAVQKVELAETAASTDMESNPEAKRRFEAQKRKLEKTEQGLKVFEHQMEDALAKKTKTVAEKVSTAVRKASGRAGAANLRDMTEADVKVRASEKSRALNNVKNAENIHRNEILEAAAATVEADAKRAVLLRAADSANDDPNPLTRILKEESNPKVTKQSRHIIAREKAKAIERKPVNIKLRSNVAAVRKEAAMAKMEAARINRESARTMTETALAKREEARLTVRKQKKARLEKEANVEDRRAKMALRKSQIQEKKAARANAENDQATPVQKTPEEARVLAEENAMQAQVAVEVAEENAEVVQNLADAIVVTAVEEGADLDAVAAVRPHIADKAVDSGAYAVDLPTTVDDGLVAFN